LYITKKVWSLFSPYNLSAWNEIRMFWKSHIWILVSYKYRFIALETIRSPPPAGQILKYKRQIFRKLKYVLLTWFVRYNVEIQRFHTLSAHMQASKQTRSVTTVFCLEIWIYVSLYITVSFYTIYAAYRHVYIYICVQLSFPIVL
jgi:hypothetical protein